MRKYLVGLLWMVALLTACAALAESAAPVICPGESVWLRDETPVLDDPVRSQQVICKLPAGANVTVLSALQEWVLIERSGDEPVRGYVKPEALCYDQVDALDTSSVELEPEYGVYAGAWINGAPYDALLLLGNEEADDMRLAVVTRKEDGLYHIAAQSEKLLSFELYRAGYVEMLDMWNDGQVYFWYTIGHRKGIYVVISDFGENDWRVTSGYVTDEEAGINFNFYYNPSEYADGITVYDVHYPQICWPIEENMTLEGFDLATISEECLEAVDYLNRFSETHHEGDQDGNHRIIW